MKGIYPLHENLLSLFRHPPPAGQLGLIRWLFLSEPRPLSHGVRTIGQPSDSLPLFGHRIWPAAFPETLIVALDLQQIIVGEFTPLLFELAFKLSPSTLELIFIHKVLLLFSVVFFLCVALCLVSRIVVTQRMCQLRRRYHYC